MHLLSQPFNGQLGDYLVEALESASFDSFSVVVAFAKNSGVLRLRDSLQKFHDNGGELHFYVGIDMNGTSYEALINLLPVTSSLRVVHAENGQTFHTKLFNFAAKDRSALVVGSHNLTGGGMWTNYESSIRLQLDHGNPNHLRMQQDINAYLKRLRGLTDTSKLIRDEVDVQELLSNNYIEKEVRGQIRRRKAILATASRQPLFGNGPRAPLPSLPLPSTAPGTNSPGQTPPLAQTKSTTPSALPPAVAQAGAAPDPDVPEDPTLWLETRKMTGAARNILDLSKTSLLSTGTVAGTQYEHTNPDFMYGAVEFFGVNPENTDVEKEILINFEGTDYSGNTIKFPKGESANGTWRLQIKGFSGAGVKITTMFQKLAGEGKFLPHKIVTFTRIRDDYYYLSVYEESELPEFSKASVVTAYNGQSKRAKRLGII